MNPVVLSFGPLTIHVFTAALLLAAALCVLLLVMKARATRLSVTRWLDAGLGALFGGIVGARAAHVLIEWPYFSASGANAAEITNISAGGLAWQGAVLGGIAGGWIVARVRRVPFAALADSAALMIPIVGVFTWVGCSASACAYGLEVRTLADYPNWLAIEAPDIYGSVAPRLNLILIGIVFCLLILAVVLCWSIFRVSRQPRKDSHSGAPGGLFFTVLGCFSLGQFVIDFFRGDYVATWFGLRADQVLDLVIFGVAVIAWIGLKLWAMRRRTGGGTPYVGMHPTSNAP